MRYIDLTSQFRDRNQYPNPSMFVSGVSDKRSDFPIHSFKSSIDDYVLKIIGGIPMAPIFDKQIGVNYIIQNVETNEETIIYNVFSTNQVQLRDKFSKLTIGSDCNVINPTTKQSIWFPDGPNEKNKFIGYYLYNKNINEYRQIISYNQNILFVDKPFSETQSITDNYDILINMKNIYNIQEVDGKKIKLDKDIPYSTNIVRFFNNENEEISEVSIVSKDTLELLLNMDITMMSKCMIYSLNEYSNNFKSCGQQLVRMSLQSLILPNVSLVDGTRIVDLPFIYVNIGNHNINGYNILSNNQIKKSSFRIPIIDTFDTDFLSLYSNVKLITQFDPSKPIYFKVFLPDGRLFETLEKDTLPPYEPNPNIQISCIIGCEYETCE